MIVQLSYLFLFILVDLLSNFDGQWLNCHNDILFAI